MRHQKNLVCLSILSILLIGQVNCAIFAQTAKVKFGETFTLKTDEAAETEDGKLEVRLKEVGRTISESGETEYVELKIRFRESEQTITISEQGNRKEIVGGYIVELINAESFGKRHCQLQISHQK